MLMLAVADYLPSASHVEIYLSGLTTLGIVGHAVNTFPTPTNQYGQWFLGIIKFAVGQRISAMNAFKGQDTVVASVPRGMAAGTGQASETTSVKTQVGPDAITTVTEKVSNTEISVPKAQDK